MFTQKISLYDILMPLQQHSFPPCITCTARFLFHSVTWVETSTITSYSNSASSSIITLIYIIVLQPRRSGPTPSTDGISLLFSVQLPTCYYTTACTRPNFCTCVPPYGDNPAGEITWRMSQPRRRAGANNLYRDAKNFD